MKSGFLGPFLLPLSANDIFPDIHHGTLLILVGDIKVVYYLELSPKAKTMASAMEDLN